MTFSLAQTSLDRYRQSLRHVSPLSAEEERELAQAWKDGDSDAGRRLIESSLPFVIRVAREYRRWGIPLEDLIQQGNVGLLKAAAKFDTEKDCRLITYAVYWIRAEIREYVVRGYRIVRLGTTRTERKAMRTFRRQNIDSPEELAETSGMPLARAKKLWPLLEGKDRSLNQTFDDYRETHQDRLMADATTPEESLLDKDQHARLRERLGHITKDLSERDRKILTERLMSEEPKTLGQLGSEFGISKERVRQLEERLRSRLRGDLSEFRPAA